MKKCFLFIWMLLLMATFAIIGYGIFYFWNRLSQIPELMEQISPWGWIAVILGALLYFLLDWLRLYTLLMLLDVRLSLFTGLRATMAGEFASMLTPTQELHIPATVYILTKSNVPVAKATAAVISKTLYMLSWVCLFGLGALYFGRHLFLPAFIADNQIYYFLPIFGIMLFFLCLMFFGQYLHDLAIIYLNNPNISRFWKKVISWIDHSTASLATIGKSTHRMHFLAHACCAGYLLTYCFIGFALCQGVGLDISWDRALCVFSISLMVAYIIPVPGSIGVTEFATSYLLDQTFSGSSLTVAILLRVCTRYLALIPGSIFFLNIVWQEGWQFFFNRRER
ncbi:MAG: lysylphosphatidylglycerol synthase transmembrane domain-containing protein [Planctomycetota bacterium]